MCLRLSIINCKHTQKKHIRDIRWVLKIQRFKCLPMNPEHKTFSALFVFLGILLIVSRSKCQHCFLIPHSNPLDVNSKIPRNQFIDLHTKFCCFRHSITDIEFPYNRPRQSSNLSNSSNYQIFLNLFSPQFPKKSSSLHKNSEHGKYDVRNKGCKSGIVRQDC